jgi:hypothetical protein
MGRKANIYIDDWEDHVASGGNESNWPGPTVEWNGQELVPSRDNINLLRKGQ